MPKINVLLLLHELTRTGAPKVVLDLFEEIQGHINLRILAPAGGGLEERCRRLGQLDRLDQPLASRGRSLFSKSAQLESLGTDLRQWKPDVVYVNSVAALSLLRKISPVTVPVLLHVHELDSNFTLFAQDTEALVDWPQRYIAVSDPVRILLTARYGIASEKISLIHELVRDEDFHAFHRRLPVNDGPMEHFVVGGAGRPEWRKGMTLWLQTAVELRRLMPRRPLRFVWVGVHDDDYFSHCFREEARRRRMDDLVEFVPVTGEPFRHFSRFDVFAMTSWEDPCPIVVLENMMLRKPVLCFAGGGGAPEEVGETGVVVADFDPAAMAREIASLASDPERRRRLGEAARARVGEHFLASVQAPNILNEIQRLARA